MEESRQKNGATLESSNNLLSLHASQRGELIQSRLLVFIPQLHHGGLGDTANFLTLVHSWRLCIDTTREKEKAW